MNTTDYREFPILASEVIENLFSEEDIENSENLDGVDFSEYGIESTEPLFLDMQDMFDWLVRNRREELTIRIYNDGHHELVGDMYMEKDVVLAKDVEKYGPISEIVTNMIMSH